MINLIVSDVSLFLCGFFAAFLFLYLRKHKAELSIIMSDLATVHQKLDKLIANIK
jgi:transposase